jgi:predicted nucleotidyltransferase
VNTTSHPLIVRLDRPVDSLLLDILRLADGAARELGIDYFVGGALARDLILLHVFGKNTGRATRDVDLGICIDDWNRLDVLRAHLIQSGNFVVQTGIAHRLIYLPSESAFGIPLDLLPYGPIERPDSTIAWPPGKDVVMNVAGFSEARASASMVQIAADLVVPVASLPSLAVLKLIAWHDRHRETPKDATDFLLIARYYADSGNLDRLYETESPLLQATNFDPELAGAMLLGKDAAAVCSTNIAKTVTGILTDGLHRQLIDQLLRATQLAGEDAATTRVEQFVDAFRMGFEDASVELA